jgi:hypothetical protein
MTKPSSSPGAATRTRAATPAFTSRAPAAELRLHALAIAQTVTAQAVLFRSQFFLSIWPIETHALAADACGAIGLGAVSTSTELRHIKKRTDFRSPSSVVLCFNMIWHSSQALLAPPFRLGSWRAARLRAGSPERLWVRTWCRNSSIVRTPLGVLFGPRINI